MENNTVPYDLYTLESSYQQYLNMTPHEDDFLENLPEDFFIELFCLVCYPIRFKTTSGILLFLIFYEGVSEP